MAAPPAVTLQEKLRFLGDPAAHAERPATVECIETHLSYVFMTMASAYKMKKPVATAMVDLRTLGARGANCRTEVNVNRRLAPDVYLGVVPLVRRDDAGLALGGTGTVVEWLVHMRRLPAASMMDAMIRAGTLTTLHVDALARRLGEFFAAQAPLNLTVPAYRDRLRDELDRSVTLLADPRFALDRPPLALLQRTLAAYLEASPDLAARVEARRIVEGHGDLRPEHVCCLVPPVVIDCIEFEPRLRQLDPFDEIAYLGLECARLGADWIGPHLHRSLSTQLEDAPPPRLVAFYTALRACIRARLAAAHLLEAAPRAPEKWLPRARDYLGYAQRACARLA